LLLNHKTFPATTWGQQIAQLTELISEAILIFFFRAKPKGLWTWNTREMFYGT
jgi:hypothetical protein